MAELAKSSGVKPNAVLNSASRQGIRVTRVAANLRPDQADAIRRDLTAREAELGRPAGGAPPPRQRPRPPSPSPSRPEATMPLTPEPQLCTCCEVPLRFMTAADRGDVGPGGRCRPCQPHNAIAEGDTDRVLSRHREHQERLLRSFTSWATRATDFEERMKAALRTRDAWRKALVRVILNHEQHGAGRCQCGATEYPCSTVRSLDRVNPHIARRVEQYSTLTDDELDAALSHD